MYDKRPKENIGKIRERGFTIIEVLLVVGMGVLLVALTLPVGLRFYQTQVADETGNDLLLRMREAESKARSGSNGSAYGVKIFPDRFVLFRGESYDARVLADDVDSPFPETAIVTSITDEFVFAPITGRPGATGTVTLLLFGEEMAIAVNEYGIISMEK